MHSNQPPIPGRAEDNRRRHFIDTTIAILAEAGYAGATFGRIAERAEVSPGLLVHYFGDKDSLMSAAFRQIGESLRSDIARALGEIRAPRARVQAVIDCFLGAQQFQQRTGAVWLAFWGQALHTPSLRRVQRVYQERMLSNLQHDLAALVPRAEARSLACGVAAMIDGIWLRAALSDWREADSVGARTLVTRFVDSQITHFQHLAPAILEKTVPGEIPRCQNWIGGRMVAGSGPVFETINPATGAVLALVESAAAAEIALAIQTARRGQKIWAKMTGAERGRILRRTAEILRRDNDAIARIEAQDTGKPIAETSTVDILSGADALEYFGALAATINGESVDLGEEAFGYTRREPIGLTAGIGAWNYPIQIACWKSAPALACGNAMIFKPAELTPLTALKLAEAFKEAGLPDGVFNVVQGARDTGKMLTAAPEIRKISLTGEVGTGRAVMADAARTLKYVTLELGGKSPLIVFDDADLDNAVSAALLANFYSAGEVCSNGTRVFVQESLKPRFLAALKSRVEKMVIGDPLDPRTDVGALISQDHMQKVLSYIEIGRQEGATLLTGGHRVTTGALAEGAFVAPTVFTDCRDDMRIVREEIFGPVMSVLGFSDEDEVITRANDTEFGLAAGVFTRDLARAHRVIARLEAGTCWINQYNITPIELPFGGFKQSGIGRENSRLALEHYTQVKSVYVALGDVASPY